MKPRKEQPIRVPKVPQKAFDAGRPPSTLLKAQIQALQAAVLAAIDTEGEAAEHIRTLTRQLKAFRPRTVPTSERDARRCGARARAARRRRIKKR
jgi:hypothetical protein